MAKEQVNILIVDDEPEIFFVIREMLKEENYDLTYASKGAEALAVVDKKDFDLVIADVFLPVMSGEELLLRIKKRSPNMNILMVSGMGDNELWVDLVNKGALDLIPKPFKKKTFLKTVHNALTGMYPKPFFRDAFFGEKKPPEKH